MTINGKNFYGMCISAANALDQNKTAINNLNVFPVPDGDTGINMSLTMNGIKDLKESSQENLSDTAKGISNLILRAARGNSGAILSLFFRGMAKTLEGLDVADSKDIAAAFSAGTEEAYKAVVSPTEGTILTVMRICAEKAVEVTKTRFQGDVAGLFLYMVQVADETLQKTPEMLPILKQAHVVDAGGSGFLTVLTGMLAFLNNDPVPSMVMQDNDGDGVSDSADFSTFDTENITFGYCTEFILEKAEDYRKEDALAALKQYLMGMGDSMVYIEDEEIVKVHVHTDHPGAVLEESGQYGAFSKVKIENMRLQHSDLATGNTEAPAPAPKAAPKVAAPEKKYGFVSVCMGDGIKETFENLGVDQIVFGGQTMNPSTQDIVNAALKVPAEIVFILPNNKNIFMVSEQAAEIITEKQLIVLHSKSVPQGIATLLAFDESASPEENTEAMEGALDSVKTLRLTHAVRDTELEGFEITSGKVMALLEGKIVAVEDTDEDCIAKLGDIMADAEFITIFYGQDTDEEAAAETEATIQAFNPEAEITLINGGQPLYEYIFSIE